MRTLYQLSTLLALATLALTPLARAQDDFGDAPLTEDAAIPDQSAGTEMPSTYPVSYSKRPLVLEKGMVEANGTLHIMGLTGRTDTFSGMTIGGSVGVIENLELGINNRRLGSSMPLNREGLIPLTFSPDLGYSIWGDMPVYGRYRFFSSDAIQIAADLVLVIPSDTDFALEAGLPVRWYATESLALDTGVQIRGTFADPSNAANIFVPIIVTYNINDEWFVGGETGIDFIFLGGDPGVDGGVQIPLILRGGYSWQKNDNLIDFFGNFGWRNLIVAGSGLDTVDGNSTPDVIDASNWELGLGVAFHTKPLF